MEHTEILNIVGQMGNVPQVGTSQYDAWIEQIDILPFLKETTGEDVPICIIGSGIFMYSVVLSDRLLKDNYHNELLHWNLNASNGWRYSYGFNKKRKPKNIKVVPPLSSASPGLVRKTIPIAFLRYFEGKLGHKSYIEILQEFTQICELHYEDSRNAYCRLDSNGDVEEVIKITLSDKGTFVTVKKDVLSKYLFLKKSWLVRFFDVTRCYDWMKYSEASREDRKIRDLKNEIFARGGVDFDKENTKTASWLRGFQIIRNDIPRDIMLNIIEDIEEDKEYESFIAKDFKHKKVHECSCDPRELDSYFVDTGKPFQTTPVFFKSEVLAKYKQDPEKFKIHSRSITCRGSWYLKTFDINKAGQVHTYLIYLSSLPYSEQKHWKIYNEPPKGGISERAYTTDFRGEFSSLYDPLDELKNSLHKLRKLKSELWDCGDTDLIDNINYLFTESPKGWSDDIGNLDKTIVEGFNHTYLKKIAKDLGCYSSQLKSIKLLQKILDEKGINQNEVSEIISTLESIHYLRMKLYGHAEGSEALKIRKESISEHGSLRAHFKDLLAKADNAIKNILGIIDEGHI